MTTLDERIAVVLADLDACDVSTPMGFEKGKALAERHTRLFYIQTQICTALDCPSFPGNPIPFATALADLVRECGTDSIKGDEAKRILWILMSQAYGQMSTVDLSDEWDRLTSMEPVS